MPVDKQKKADATSPLLYPQLPAQNTHTSPSSSPRSSSPSSSSAVTADRAPSPSQQTDALAAAAVAAAASPADPTQPDSSFSFQHTSHTPSPVGVDSYPPVYGSADEGDVEDPALSHEKAAMAPPILPDSTAEDAGLMRVGSIQQGMGEKVAGGRSIWVKFGASVVGVAMSLFFIFYFVTLAERDDDDSPLTACDIVCSGIIQQTIQFAGLFNDSKTFVDMPLVREPREIKKDFDSLKDYSQASLASFVTRNFDDHCSDMLLWDDNPDYHPDPAFLALIDDPDFKKWGKEVHELWNLLGRQIAPEVYKNPHRHTLLPLESPYMIVPGGRFCEFFYWDTYWIIHGLLVSGMTDTAKIIVNNLLWMVRKYGFIPNGTRQYFLNRSQPPMLTLMVQQVYQATGDKEWLKEAMPTLEKEYRFWMEGDDRAVRLKDALGQEHVLNRYFADTVRPRPESYVEDEITAWLLFQQVANETELERFSPAQRAFQAHDRKLVFDTMEFNNMFEARLYQTNEAARMLEESEEQTGPHTQSYTASSSARPTAFRSTPPPPPIPLHDDDPRMQNLFRELSAAAETGWDFSSRWFSDRNNLTSVEATNLVPVDLNAILYAVEVQIGSFFQEMGNDNKATEYATHASKRMKAIHNLLFNETAAQWQDYHLDHGQWRAEAVLSNFIPLWTKCYDRKLVNEGSVVSALLQSGLIMDGGIVTTLNNNTQQWDFPNAWPPLNWMIIEGIATSEYESRSTLDNFQIYNSSALPPGSDPMPDSACDIVQPGTWFNCSARATGGDCTWCFPGPRDLSDAIGQRWLLANWVAYNETGYMLEKYYAPRVGGVGAGGEYEVQKGFGWTNGAALHLLTRYGKDPRFNLQHLLDTQEDYPFSRMAAYVDTSPLVPDNPPGEVAKPVEQEALHRQRTHAPMQHKTEVINV